MKRDSVHKEKYWAGISFGERCRDTGKVFVVALVGLDEGEPIKAIAVHMQQVTLDKIGYLPYGHTVDGFLPKGWSIDACDRNYIDDCSPDNNAFIWAGPVTPDDIFKESE